MKDIIITSKQIKKELYILLGSFIFAFLLNIVAVAIYKTPWVEIFTQFGYVVVITVVTYLLIGLVRFIISLIRKLFTRK